MKTQHGPHSQSSKPGKDFSSGVFMTVWQQVPNRPEFQIMARQHEELMELEAKLAAQEARLAETEEKLRKIEITYNSLLRSIKHIIGD